MSRSYAEGIPTHDLPDNLLAEIGRCLTLFAHIEWRLARFTYALLRLDREEGRLAVRDQRAGEQVATICDLLAHRQIKSNADTNGLQKRLKAAESQRNLLAHGIWLKDPIYDQWRVISWSGSWQISPGRGAKLKRKMAPEGVLFDLPELAELHETLLGILADIEAWIAEFAPPKA